MYEKFFEFVKVFPLDNMGELDFTTLSLILYCRFQVTLKVADESFVLTD